MYLSVRSVPWEWEHTIGKDGKYVALYDDSFSCCVAQYNERKQKWKEGLMEVVLNFNGIPKVRWDPIPRENREKPFEMLYADPPVPEMFRPDWYREFCPCYQMYDAYACIPLSPVYWSTRLLAEWCQRAVVKGLIDPLNIILFPLPSSRIPCPLDKILSEKAGYGVRYQKLPLSVN